MLSSPPKVEPAALARRPSRSFLEILGTSLGVQLLSPSASLVPTRRLPAEANPTSPVFNAEYDLNAISLLYIPQFRIFFASVLPPSIFVSFYGLVWGWIRPPNSSRPLAFFVCFWRRRRTLTTNSRTWLQSSPDTLTCAVTGILLSYRVHRVLCQLTHVFPPWWYYTIRHDAMHSCAGPFLSFCFFSYVTTIELQLCSNAFIFGMIFP